LWEQLQPADIVELDFSLDADLASRLVEVARVKGVSCDELVHRFVSERLYEEEKREGILPS
jgi:hypothetical protein